MTDSGQRSDAKFEIEDELDYLFANASPNPNREGCPSREVLIGLARREKPIGHQDYLHIVRCSPCFREFRAIQQANKAKTRGRKLWAVSAAAVLVLAVAAGAWIMLRDDRPPAPIAGEKPMPAVPPDLAARLDLRPYIVTRGGERRPEPDPVVIPVGRVNATLLLPVGAEPGKYEIRLLDQDLTPRASATGSAAIRDYITTLEAVIDSRALAAGRYQLGIRRVDGEWQLFPALLR
jgi:hypothetical protein